MAVAALCLLNWHAQAEVLEGRVVGVNDGDTLSVLIGGRAVSVRLAEIDAPEKAQPYGQASKVSLSGMTVGRGVSLDVQTTDRYGRTVARVYAEDVDVCREQVRRGMTWAYRQYLRGSRLLTDEGGARSARRGLWSDSKPVAPREWRKARRNHTSSGM